MTATETQEMVPAPPQAVGKPQGTKLFEGFEGAAVAPFSDEARKVLAEPVDPRDVEIRPDGIVYLSGVWYRRQLIRAFGAGGWTLLPRSAPQKAGENVVYHGALIALGRFVGEAMGECQTRNGMSYASALEGARTDCITRCCKDLGMATELWDRTWRNSWMKDCAHKGNDGKWYKNDGAEHDMVPLYQPPRETVSAEYRATVQDSESRNGGAADPQRPTPESRPGSTAAAPSPPPSGIKNGRTKGDYKPANEVPPKSPGKLASPQQLAEIDELQPKTWDPQTFAKAVNAYKCVGGKRAESSADLQDHQADNLLKRMRAQAQRNAERLASMDAATEAHGIPANMGGREPIDLDNAFKLNFDMLVDEQEWLNDILGLERREDIPLDMYEEVAQLLFARQNGTLGYEMALAKFKARRA